MKTTNPRHTGAASTSGRKQLANGTIATAQSVRLTREAKVKLHHYRCLLEQHEGQPVTDTYAINFLLQSLEV